MEARGNLQPAARRSQGEPLQGGVHDVSIASMVMSIVTITITISITITITIIIIIIMYYYTYYYTYKCYYFRGNRSSNATRLTQVLFERGERCSNLRRPLTHEKQSIKRMRAPH